MDPGEFASQVAGVAALAEPVRRDLYLYVAAQPNPVSRDQASQGVGVPRHTAKFHLDRLVEAGLLDIDFKRLSGREGPGAGRPTKHYRRSRRQVSVAVPERRYDLVGELMSTAIEESARTGADAVEALSAAAARHGTVVAQRARERAGRDRAHPSPVSAIVDTLADLGYEPRLTGDTIMLVNCPFQTLAADHTELVCGMNLAMLQAVVHQCGDGSLVARLDPAPERCCVVMVNSDLPVATHEAR
ncbi:MAG: helix-turn-helix transcriptional regulator [Candidatus Nanopelagicales bacterium]